MSETIPELDSADIDQTTIDDFTLSNLSTEDYPDGLPVRDLDEGDDEEES
jgi:hypothetical protein